MRRSISLLMLATVSACAGGGRTAPTSEARAAREGIYEFSASILGNVVRGKLHVLPDTILVESESGECGPVTSDSRFFRVGCRGSSVYTTDQLRGVSGALLMFDRGNPGQGAKWAGNFPVQRRREVCARYEVRNGREVCAAMKAETYETLEPKSGPVQMRRVL